MIVTNADVCPRLVLYHQTIHEGDRYLTLRPLLDYQAGVTHLIIAAIHLNGPRAQNPIHLNDLPPEHSRFAELWQECQLMQSHGVKVMCMLGGAAKGTYALLDLDDERFTTQYALIKQLIIEHKFDGIDLDVEEYMSIEGMTRLIQRLRDDFGPQFIISLAPVATAMHDGRNLSGFNYKSLEVWPTSQFTRPALLTCQSLCGKQIDFYNVQFYCGHGSLLDTSAYEKILQHGWPARKIVVGSLTSWRNGHGWLPIVLLKKTWSRMKALSTLSSPNISHNNFGGVMGWEYFNSRPGGSEAPHQWCCIASRLLRDKAAP